MAQKKTTLVNLQNYISTILTLIIIYIQLIRKEHE